MANCHVLEAHQKPTDRPSKRIKRSGGHSLVRQRKADWIVENVLLKMRHESEHPAKAPAISNPYIPWGLEPSIDAQIGVILQIPALPNQVRFRHV